MRTASNKKMDSIIKNGDNLKIKTNLKTFKDRDDLKHYYNLKRKNTSTSWG